MKNMKIFLLRTLILSTFLLSISLLSCTETKTMNGEEKNIKGEELFKFETRDDICSSPAVVKDVVYFGSNDDHLYALDAKTGDVKWYINPEDWVDSSPYVVDGIVYFGCRDWNLYAVDVKTGQKKWRFF
ncbi:MAG: PQQ-like beta-propeller repeat protein, partial [Deltaproteobacteria bacterium]|nr:PQQ-like beta-propeller repeat protein [Candidatus Zymogenaceae bacterium]